MPVTQSFFLFNRYLLERTRQPNSFFRSDVELVDQDTIDFLILKNFNQKKGYEFYSTLNLRLKFLDKTHYK